MSIYGNSLIHFAEQFETVTYFSQIPSIESGYTPGGEEKKVRVIFQTGVGSELAGPGKKQSKYTKWGVQAEVMHNSIWATEKLEVGYFIKKENDSFVYRIITEKNWLRLAGFFAYHIERVTGDDGSKPEQLEVISGKY